MLRKKIASALIAVACVTGVALGAAPAASAASYGIDINKACAYFTNVGWAWAKPLDVNNAYSWRCSTKPAPGWQQWNGSLDLSLWCAYWHNNGNAYAYTSNPGNAYSWQCIVP